MELADLIELAGPEKYADARDVAWQIAASYDERHDTLWTQERFDVVQDLLDEIEERFEAGEFSLEDRVDPSCALYRDMPSYTALNWAWHVFDPDVSRIPNQDQPSFLDAEWAWWAEVRSWVDDLDVRLATPILWSLDMDWFWHGDRGARMAWLILTEEGSLSDLGMGRIIEYSSSVAWSLKEPVFERFAQRGEHWHQVIYEAILRGWRAESTQSFKRLGVVTDRRAAARLLASIPVQTVDPSLEEARRELLSGKRGP